MDVDKTDHTLCCGPEPSNTGLAKGTGDGLRFYCSGAKCAAWRWLEGKRTAAFSAALVKHMKETGQPYNKAIQEVLKRLDEFEYTEGCCGYAGREGAGNG